jgi:undecaprenyl-diphosphatase
VVAVGSYYVFYALLAGVAIFLLVSNRKHFWNYIYTVAAAYFVSLLLKYTIHRPRPSEDYRLIKTIIENDPSFPSSHATVFFAIAALLSFIYPKHKYWLFAVATILAFTRLYLGLHFLSDLVAGAITGFLVGFCFRKRTT